MCRRRKEASSWLFRSSASPDALFANLTLDEGVVAFMDSEARRRHMTRKAFVEWMTRRIAQQGG